ncbi:hypothetical protein JWG39_13470 [Desulforhopalus vacuolatus]|uniref:hypothetical protein n=1 Tax=Desulforhopalus vacuolatus TaxID=40414 RepID=UPI001962850C|nr:hypothetical protein [Desulforhopalus vacuolatus]MBM9520827.1 hypothetical protein [Desulforhopalus vacuolatus]
MMITILTGLSIALGGYIAIMNWYTIYASYTSEKNVSSVPFFGAFFLVLGLLGFPLTSRYAWAGILVDYGTLVLLLALPMLAWDSWTTSRFNLLYRFLADADGRRDDIRMFKRNKFTIKTDYDPPIPGDEHGALVLSQGRVGKWLTAGDSFCLEGYEEDRILRIRKNDGEFITEEENYPDNNEFQHDRMGGLILKQLK